MRRGLWTLGLVVCQVVCAAGVIESEKTLPLVQDVDVVVVGGSSGAVAAACRAAKEGAKVFLVAPRPYLGEDVAGKLRLRGEEGEDSRCDMGKRMFTGVPDRTTPLNVKKTLDEALLNAKIPFLTGAHATEPLFDAAGKLSGVVIADRSGRQVIKAKVVLDGQ